MPTETDAIQLELVAGRALDRPVAEASIGARSEIAYDPFLPGRTVDRVTGLARLADGSATTWTAIVKRTEEPGLRDARRELDAWRVGIADPDGAGLRAPQLLAARDDDRSVELWLEALTDKHGGRWSPARFGVAARHVAAADARAADLALPPDFDSEDAWAERHGQPERVDEAVAELGAIRRDPAAPAIAAAIDDDGFRRTESMIVTTAARIARLAELPVVPMHHDLVRSNLFALTDGSTAAIDWEHVGRGPFGVDLAPLVVGSVRRGEASADDLAAIERLVLDGYIETVEAASAARAADIRRAYRLAVGLRWHVVLGTIRAWLDPRSGAMRGSRRGEAGEDALRHLLVLTRHLLSIADAEPL